MRINLKTVQSSFFISFVATLLTASAVKAQQSTFGTVLSAEEVGENCSLTIQVEGVETPIVEVTEVSVCDRILTGDTIQLSYTYTISAIEVVSPPTVATVISLQQGDRACYLELEDTEGNRTTQFASFEVCTQDILNQPVALTYEIGNILAFSCQGDIDCGRTDTVRLISQAEVTHLPNITPPTTTEPPTPLLISDLPDGNYRYWSGTSNSAIVSDEALLANGGELFLFRKSGDNIVGVFGEIDQEALCIQGQVNENTVTGISVQNLQGATVRSAGEDFVAFGNTDNLRVRRGRQIDSNTVRYSSTILDLSDLSRINAGSKLPVFEC